MHDLKSKPHLRAKYGVMDEWVLHFEIIPIINILECGGKVVQKVCMDMNVNSQNEKEKLGEDKKLTYLKGFIEGTVLVGEGMRVNVAKLSVKSMPLKMELAIIYTEPNK